MNKDNDKLHKLNGILKHTIASIESLKTSEQQLKLQQYANENDDFVVLKSIDPSFLAFIVLNEEIQSDDWNSIFNIKKIRPRAERIAHILTYKNNITNIPSILRILLYRCYDLEDQIMFTGLYHSHVEDFDWLVGQTINSIDEISEGNKFEIKSLPNPIGLHVNCFPCDECDAGYAILENFTNIAYTDHKIINVSQTKTKEDNNYYEYEVTVTYDDKQTKSFMFKCYHHYLSCYAVYNFGFISLHLY